MVALSSASQLVLLLCVLTDEPRRLILVHHVALAGSTVVCRMVGEILISTIVPALSSCEFASEVRVAG
jgi:hypothetical protein